jgi:predicted alpha/beta superfamily hydrolase
VWLPPGYSDPANVSRKYPALYMLDGQNMFDVCPAMGHAEWQIDEALTRLIGEGKVEPIIVVGIDSPGNDDRRSNELLPMSDPGINSMLEPHGQQFPAFLAREVMPRVAANYRVRTGRAFTAIGGSSYGAIAALYVLMMHADMFGIGLLESPSLQVGNGEFCAHRNTWSKPLCVCMWGLATTKPAASATGSSSWDSIPMLSIANLLMPPKNFLTT